MGMGGFLANFDDATLVVFFLMHVLRIYSLA